MVDQQRVPLLEEKQKQKQKPEQQKQKQQKQQHVRTYFRRFSFIDTRLNFAKQIRKVIKKEFRQFLLKNLRFTDKNMSISLKKIKKQEKPNTIECQRIVKHDITETPYIFRFVGGAPYEIIPKNKLIQKFSLKVSLLNDEDDTSLSEIKIIQYLSKNFLKKKITPHICNYIHSFQHRRLVNMENFPQKIYYDVKTIDQKYDESKEYTILVSEYCNLGDVKKFLQSKILSTDNTYKNHRKQQESQQQKILQQQKQSQQQKILQQKKQQQLQKKQSQQILTQESPDITENYGLNIDFSLDKQFMVLLFQLYTTLLFIYDKDKNFKHNDLKIDNVLVHEFVNDSSKYCKYSYDGTNYYLPCYGFQIRLWDFDRSITRKIDNSEYNGVLKESKLWTEMKFPKHYIPVVDNDFYYFVLHFYKELYGMIKKQLKKEGRGNGKKQILNVLHSNFLSTWNFLKTVLNLYNKKKKDVSDKLHNTQEKMKMKDYTNEMNEYMFVTQKKELLELFRDFKLEKEPKEQKIVESYNQSFFSKLALS
jgi:hypothetical protein